MLTSSMRQTDPTTRRGLVGWVLFDCAAQPFFTLVTTFVFAPFFASSLAATPAEGQSLWGYATAAAGLVTALLAPLMGSIADASGARKPWIAAFALPYLAACLALWFTAPGEPWSIAIALSAFAIGTIAIEFATLFNNAMMGDLVPKERLGRLSGTGWAMGYAGGLASLVLTLGFLAASPETGRTLLGFDPLFGLDPTTRAGDRASGPLSALWFVVFVLPLFLFTPDAPRRMGYAAAIRQGRARLWQALMEVRRAPSVGRFLIANMIFADGLVALFAFGGIYAAGVLGWGTIQIGSFGILLTITGTAGALIGGWLDDRIGAKPVILGALGGLIFCGLGIVSIDRDTILFVLDITPAPAGALFASAADVMFLGLGAVIGAMAGPLQASARSLLVHLSPPGRGGAYFGLFALSGKVTSFLAPLSVALVTSATGSQAAGMAVILVFFTAGALVLSGVRVNR